MPAWTSPCGPRTVNAPAATSPSKDLQCCAGALYEASVYAARPSSPDYADYRRLRQRLEAHIALITIARKLARRCYHTLRNTGDAFAVAA
jgi:hypothetical protein